MSLPHSIGNWRLQLGALWVLPTGETYPVKGFHKEWLAEHPEVAQGLSESVDVILRLNWLSVVVLKGGRLEICAADLDDEETLQSIRLLLSTNAGEWSKALIISMREEGYVRFDVEEFKAAEDFGLMLAALRASPVA